MGTGKTSLAQALGPGLAAEVLSSDIVRKQLAGTRPAEPARAAWGQGIYGDEFSQRTYAELHRRAAALLRAGGIVVLDASYRTAAWRAEARRTAQAAGAPFLLLEVVCPDELVRERLAARGAGPSDGRVELLERQRAAFEPPVELAADEHARIDTSAAPEEVAAAALGAIYRKRLAAGSR
jgi:predicted kinase